MPASQITDLWFQTTKTNRTAVVSSSVAILNTITHMLWCTVPLILMFFGTFGNMMIVAVMRRLRHSQSTACLSVYFTALAVSDQCLLTTVLWLWVDTLFSWPPSFFRFDLLCTVTYFVWYACTQTSAWFLVAMTYQRVTSVVAPHRVGVLCTVKRGKIIIVVVCVVVFLLNFHFLFTFTYSPEYRECVSQEKYTYFIDIYTVLDLFVASVVPFLLLFLGNCILIAHVVASVQTSRRMRGNTTHSGKTKIYPMTRTLILTSSAFLALTLPICVFDAHRRTLSSNIADEYISAQINMVQGVTQMMWFTASASNFYLYLLSGSKFREESKRWLGLCGERVK